MKVEILRFQDHDYKYNISSNNTKISFIPSIHSPVFNT